MTDLADDGSGQMDMAMDDMPCCPLTALCLATTASLLPTAVALPGRVGMSASLTWPASASFARGHGTPLPESARA